MTDFEKLYVKPWQRPELKLVGNIVNHEILINSIKYFLTLKLNANIFLARHANKVNKNASILKCQMLQRESASDDVT